MLITSETGEFAFIHDQDLRDLVAHRLPSDSSMYQDLRARRFLIENGGDVHRDLWEAQYRTRKSFLGDGPSLHIFVVSLRCDHSCSYCQVSRQNVSNYDYDMSDETMAAAIDRVFEAPSKTITVEFQGGEPALAFDTVIRVVEQIEARNVGEYREIRFSMVSTLQLMTNEMLEFCRDHRIHLSTSLDGPAHVHDSNRFLKRGSSYDRTVEAIERARSIVGNVGLAALTTITRLSLKYPKEIIDTYVDLGFDSVFLRPLSQYGFAVRAYHKIGYSVAEYVAFYREALRYLIQLNVSGVPIVETYTSILLSHILTPYPTGYTDLRSPAGAGLGSLVYNYDGGVYASDEGRMLAESGDQRFRLGNVHTPYPDLMASAPMRWILASGIAEALPGCSDCAYLPYCGADPIFHAAQHGDPVGHRPTSDFCKRQTALFQILFAYLACAEPEPLRVLMAWLGRRPSSDVRQAGSVA